MKLNHADACEATILSRIIEPDKPTLSPEAARCLLALEFPSSDKKRMHRLALKNQERGLNKEEQKELESYRRIGRLLDLLSAKARLSLQKSSQAD